jgi:hypothetical protein
MAVGATDGRSPTSGDRGRMPGLRHEMMGQIGTFFSIYKATQDMGGSSWENVKFDTWTSGDAKSTPPAIDFATTGVEPLLDFYGVPSAPTPFSCSGFQFKKFTKSAWYIHFHTTVHCDVSSMIVGPRTCELGIAKSYASSPADTALLGWLRQKFSFYIGDFYAESGSDLDFDMSIGGIVVPSVDFTDGSSFSVIAKSNLSNMDLKYCSLTATKLN